MEESLKDESLINLSHSNMHYDNVGTLYCNYSKEKREESQLIGEGFASVVYIGDIFCLTVAHAKETNSNYAVCFEIKDKKNRFYSVSEFIIHPNYKENYRFDIAVLILNEPVDGLNGLRPSYEFSRENRNFNDYEHLLTYIGYDSKRIYNDWFYFENKKRRAIQGHTRGCYTTPETLEILSTPRGKFNTLTGNRPFIHYEARGSCGMSGGAVIHAEYGLVSIISHIKHLKTKYDFVKIIGSNFLYCINSLILEPINLFLFPVMFFRYDFAFEAESMSSVPLSPVQNWIEEIKAQYENYKV